MTYCNIQICIIISGASVEFVGPHILSSEKTMDIDRCGEGVERVPSFISFPKIEQACRL